MMTTWTDDKEQELFEAQETIGDLLMLYSAEQNECAGLHATNAELLEALEFALSELSDMTTDQFSKGADKQALERMAEAIRKQKAMNPYQEALARIIELEDELEIAEMRTSLDQAVGGDLGNQLRATFALLAEARDLLVITALESPLRKDIMELIERIDEFYPRGE